MPGPVPLKPTTVRFADDSMELVKRAADQAGVSLSQFVREAALIRAALILRESEDLAAMSQRVVQLARKDDP